MRESTALAGGQARDEETAGPEEPSQRLDPGIIWPKDRWVRTDDGADIAYTFLGPDDGPVIALCSGFLCPDTWWAALAPALAGAGYRVLLFHYRGTAVSRPPRQPGWHGRGLGRDAFTIPRFAADLQAIVEQESIASLAVAGHSMGSQVALEAYRLMPDRVRAILSLTGPYASPVHTLYGVDYLGLLLYPLAQASVLLSPPPLVRALWRFGWGRLPIARLGKLVRALGPRMDPEAMRSYVEHGAVSDPYIAALTTSGMHAHSAEDLLPEIDVPVLVVAGGKDPFSPPSLGRTMAERIPDAVLRIAPLGTHGTMLEYPESVNGWVLDFLDDRFPA
jgi:pimeloyl-ACP methyl ester carboxylesterase